MINVYLQDTTTLIQQAKDEFNAITETEYSVDCKKFYKHKYVVKPSGEEVLSTTQYLMADRDDVDANWKIKEGTDKFPIIYIEKKVDFGYKVLWVYC